MAGPHPEPPLDLCVGRGAPSDDELAVLVAVLGAVLAERAGDGEPDPPARRPMSCGCRAHRRPVRVARRPGR